MEPSEQQVTEVHFTGTIRFDQPVSMAVVEAVFYALTAGMRRAYDESITPDWSESSVLSVIATMGECREEIP